MNQLERHPKRQQFTQAIAEEMSTLNSRGTFADPDATILSTPILTKWVFSYKKDDSGNIVRYKARLVVRGDLEPVVPGEMNYAATLPATEVRALIAVIAHFDLETLQMDAVNAFINAPLDSEETVHVTLPDGKTQKLKRALYGLRRSPKKWFETLSGYLQTLGFKQSASSCVWIHHKVICFFYVDDIILAGPDHSLLEYFAEQIADMCPTKKIGDLKWFLNILVERNRTKKSIKLNQSSYIQKVAQEFEIDVKAEDNKKPRITPLRVTSAADAAFAQHKQQTTKPERKHYQKLIGSILYATTITRPDCAKATNLLSQHLQNPGPEHLKMAMDLLEHLVQTRSRSLVFISPLGSTPSFYTMGDAAFANANSIRSSIGVVNQLNSVTSTFGTIAWRATRIPSIVTSVAEAEMYAAETAARTAIHWTRFFAELGPYNLTGSLDISAHQQSHELSTHAFSVVPPPGFKTFDPPPVIATDNAATMRVFHGNDALSRSRLLHVNLRRLWIRQEIKNGRLKFEQVPSERMAADGFTKLLDAQQHTKFVRQLGLSDS
jgi:hypothetical protein